MEGRGMRRLEGGRKGSEGESEGRRKISIQNGG